MDKPYRLARVTKLYPGDPSADIIYMDDYWPSPRVPLTLPCMTSNAGTFDLPFPDPVLDEADIGSTSGRAMIAMVTLYKGYPVITGFLPPAVCEMLFAEPNRFVKRFASDVVVTADDAGNIEVFHPNGTYFRIGETPAHDDLTGKDVNKRFELKRNADKATHIALVLSNAGTEKAHVTIDPDGNADIMLAGKLDASIGGALAASVGGTLTAEVNGAATVTAPSVRVNASSNVTLNTPSVVCTGNLSVSGNATVGGVVSAGSQVIVGSIGLTTHKHPTAAPGDPSSPVP